MSGNNKIQDGSDDPLPLIYHNGSISFPLAKEEFVDLLANLLGKPEVIEGRITGAFEIDLNRFENINYQIDSYINSTNNAFQIEFTAQLFYDDNSSYTFNSVEKLRKYKEVRPLLCVNSVFTWGYLVEFKSDRPAEKQEITISTISSISWLGKYIIPEISYSIRSTVPNWGMIMAQRVGAILESTCLIEFPFRDFRIRFQVGFFFITRFRVDLLTFFPR